MIASVAAPPRIYRGSLRGCPRDAATIRTSSGPLEPRPCFRERFAGAK